MRKDLDNPSKVSFGCLAKDGIIYDDDQVYHLDVTKPPTQNARIKVTVMEWF